MESSICSKSELSGLHCSLLSELPLGLLGGLGCLICFLFWGALSLESSHPSPACPSAGLASQGHPHCWQPELGGTCVWALPPHPPSGGPGGDPQHWNMNKVTWTHTSSSPPLQHPLWSGSRNRSTEEHVKVMQDTWMEKENKRKKEGYYGQKWRGTERDRPFEIHPSPRSLRAEQQEEPHSPTSI